MTAARLAAARAALAEGRAPAPPEGAVFVGDGDFRAIGAEYLGYFVEEAGLRPDHRVLDVGCGIGRMAAALSCFLEPPAGRYLGFDPVADGIAWCRAAFAHLPHFAFLHADVANDLYNPGGAVADAAFVFPAADRSADLVIATSVFTHMREGGIARYLAEAARVLAPGGRLFATAFLYAPPSPAALPPVQHLAFTRPAADAPHRWHAEGLPDLAAVAYAEGPFAATAEAILGRPVRVAPGRWRGGAGPWFQDLVVSEAA